MYQLRGFTEAEFQSIEIRTDRRLTLGNKKLSFQVLTDKFAGASLYILDLEDGFLVTADAFGSVIASEQVLASEMEDKEAYLRGAVRYCADIFGEKRFKTMEAAVTLVRQDGVKRILPACGPVADWDLDRLAAIFLRGKEEPAEKLTVAVIYAAGNYVSELADRIEAGILECFRKKVRLERGQPGYGAETICRG